MVWHSSDERVVPLHAHVEALTPAGVSMQVTKCVPLADMCLLHCNVEKQFSVLGLEYGGGPPAAANMQGRVGIRALSFCAARPEFVSYVMPYTDSQHMLQLTKRNVSMDAAESFVVCDEATRADVKTKTTNDAYFLNERCNVCGCELDDGKTTQHSCSFFCVAACQVESGATKNIVTYIEHNVLARVRGQNANASTTSAPCMSMHVVSPVRMLSACYSVIDALEIMLRHAAGLQLPPGPAQLAMPCPFFLQTMPVDVMCLSRMIEFYVECLASMGFSGKKRAAVAGILVAVGGYVLRNSVAKPIIVPFVSLTMQSGLQSWDIRHYIKTPMPLFVSVLHKSRLRLHGPGGGLRALYRQQAAAAGVPKEVATRDFLCFLSDTGTTQAEIENALLEWTAERALSMGAKSGKSHGIQYTIGAGFKPVPPGPVNPNPKLTALLYAVRCFFYKNQQMFYREVLQIPDPSKLTRPEMVEIELRFLHLLCCLDTARNRVEYDPKDVCNIVTRLAAA